MRPRADIARVVSVITDALGSRAPAQDDATEPMPDWDFLGQPEPEFQFDQRIAW